MIACPSRPADNRQTSGTESAPVVEGEEATSGVRIVMRDNVSADPGVNPLRAAAKHSMAVNLLCWDRLQQAGELGGPQSEHTARHRPPVTPANTESA
jgi:hypothetical protein